VIEWDVDPIGEPSAFSIDVIRGSEWESQIIAGDGKGRGQREMNIKNEIKMRFNVVNEKMTVRVFVPEDIYFKKFFDE